MKISELPEFCSYDEFGQRRVSVSTQQRVYTNAAARLVEFLGDKRVTKLSPADLLTWQDWLDGRGNTVDTRNTYVRTARAMLNYARSRGFVMVDTTGIFKLKQTRHKSKSISEPNAWRLLAATGIRDAAFLMLLWDSGRRRGGLAQLQVDDIKIIFDAAEEEYRLIGRTIEKGEKEQLVLAGHEATMALKVWLTIREGLLQALAVQDHGFVFVNCRNGLPISLGALSAMPGRLAMAAGISTDENTSLHSFRHRAAKDMLKTLSLPEVRDILGHTSAKTTADIYAASDEDELIKRFFDRDKDPEGRGGRRGQFSGHKKNDKGF